MFSIVWSGWFSHCGGVCLPERWSRIWRRWNRRQTAAKARRWRRRTAPQVQRKPSTEVSEMQTIYVSRHLFSTPTIIKLCTTNTTTATTTTTTAILLGFCLLVIRPKAFGRFGRIVDLPYGPKERPLRGQIKSNQIKSKTHLYSAIRRKRIRGAYNICYNSAESEIWNVVSQMFGAGPGRFWARSATIWQGAEIFFGEVNNARFQRFPVGQILRHFNTTTSIVVAMQT